MEVINNIEEYKEFLKHHVGVNVISNIHLTDEEEQISLNKIFVWNYDGFVPRTFPCICISANFSEGNRKDYVDLFIIYPTDFDGNEHWIYDKDYDNNIYCFPSKLLPKFEEYNEMIEWGEIIHMPKKFDKYELK